MMPRLKSHAEQVDMFRRANAAADVVEYGEMPDYKTNEIGWTARMRARMATGKDMHRTGLGKKDMNFNIILDDVITHLTEQGCMGDEKAAWKQLHTDARAYIHNRRRSRDENKRYAVERLEIIAYGKSLGMTDSELSSQMVGTPRGKGYEKRCKDHFDYYVKMHPREVTPPDESGNGFFVAMVEGRDVKPDIEAQNEQSRREYAAITEGRDVITEAMIDEHELNADKIVFALPAHLAKSFGNTAGLHVRKIFDGAIDTWLSAHNNDTRLAWRLTLQYELKNDPIENAPESPNLQPSAIPVPPPPSNAPEALDSSLETAKQKENVEVTQHLLKVYPVNFGSTYYKGVKFSVTLCSADATWTDAVTLMDEFVAHKECIAPDCFVAPSNVTPMVQQPAQTTPPTSVPSVQGNKPVQSEQIVKVMREFDQKGKFEFTGLYTNFGNAPGKYATYKVKDGTPHAAKVNAITSVDWSAVKMGVEAPGGFIAFFKDADTMNASGKPYHDLIDLSVTMERTA